MHPVHLHMRELELGDAQSSSSEDAAWSALHRLHRTLIVILHHTTGEVRIFAFLQVPEGYVFDNMYYDWNTVGHVSPVCPLLMLHCSASLRAGSTLLHATPSIVPCAHPAAAWQAPAPLRERRLCSCMLQTGQNAPHALCTAAVSCMPPHKSDYLTMFLSLRALLQGFPTANLHPADCRSRLECPCFDLAGNPAWDATISRLNQMPNGVYFGCGAS